MKNRLLVVAMTAMCAIGMISCGNPAGPEDFTLTEDNVDNYILELGEYKGLTVEASKEEFTDELVEYYANYYYDKLCHEYEGMLSEDGTPIPMTDSAISMLNSKVFTTVSQYMVFIRNTVEEFIEYEYEQEVARKALIQTAENSKFAPLPKELVNKEKEIVTKDYTRVAESYDLTLKKYLKYIDVSLDDLAKEYAYTDILYTKLAIELDISLEDFDEAKERVNDYLYKVTTVNLLEE